MERIEGLRIDLGLDTAQIEGGLTGLKSKLKTVNSEMKASLSAFDKADQSVEKYQTTLDGLNRKLELQKAIVEQTRKKYEEIVKTYGEGSKEADKAAREYNHQAASLNNLQRYIKRTSDKLEELQRQQRESTSAWAKFKKRVDKAGDSLTGLGEKASDVGNALTASLTAPIAGFGALMGKAANDFDVTAGRLQAQLGLTKEEAEKLGDVAENVWTRGFGESVGEVGDAISKMSHVMKDIPLDVLEDMTASAFVLSETFGADVQETTRAASQLIKQFGVDGIAAMDMITAAFQRGGDFSGELLETITEYSPQFKNLGFTASDMLGLFVSGAEAGIWSLDKLADTTKESFLQITDGAKGTAEAIQELGLDYDQIIEDIQSGGDKANAAFAVVMSALAGVENQSDRNRLAIELMGTPLEDLGVQFVDFFANADEGFSDFEGAAKGAAGALQDNLGARARKLWRQFLKDMEPVGETLVDIGEDILPKVAKGAERLADMFSELSPEGKKTAVTLGLIAGATGPIIGGFGLLTKGAGSFLKILSPLIPSLGTGKGLLGILRRIPGPIGAVATGIGLATGGFSLYKSAVEKANEVNLENAETLLEQKKNMEELSTEYERLRDKNKLSNDELLRLRDISKELELAESAEEIARLKEEQEKLQQKSGLTNEELAELYRLNDEIVKQAPSVNQSFSDRGSAIIENMEALKQVNEEVREQLRLELETQRIKADANLSKHVADYVSAAKEIRKADAELDESRAKRDAQRETVRQREIEHQKAILSGDEARITIAKNELLLAEGTLAGLETEVSKRADVLAEKQKSLSAADEEIRKTQKIYDQLVDIQLANAGINKTGAEGIAQLDDAIAKNQARINTLLTIQNSEAGLTEEQRKELEILQRTLETQQNSRDEIRRIKGEQENVNRKIDDGKKKAQDMTKELGKKVKKDVNVDDKGKAKKIHQEAAKDATKRVTLSAIWQGLTRKAKDVLGFAKGTKNAPGGLAVVGEKGPELLYIPKGSKVIPNNDTRKIFKNWNIPGFKTGGIVTRPGIYQLAEDGFSEFVIPTNPSRRTEAAKLLALAAKTIGESPGAPMTAAATHGSSALDVASPKQPIIVQLVTPDQRELARWMIDDINELQKTKTARLNLFERRQ